MYFLIVYSYLLQMFSTVIKSPDETKLPVEILDIRQFLPLDFELLNRNQSSNSTYIISPSQSELQLIWDLGTVYNIYNPDGITNESDVVVLMYILTISLTNITNIPLQITTYAIANNDSILLAQFNATIVEPQLSVVKDVQVKLRISYITFT